MATKKAPAAPAAEAKQIPWWGKVLVGALGVTLIAKYTPILEIMTMFFYVVMIPLMLLAAVGLVSAGTLEAVSSGWTNTVQEINRRVTEKVKAAA
tara:strand:+ start:2717 stop:3001 length:285 start_codon:yes stop_codon:yes gene_type:complete